MARPIRILTVIDDLRAAGAQRVVAEEVLAFTPDRVQFDVVTLADSPGTSLAPELARRGIRIWRLPGRGLVDPRRLGRLTRVIRRTRPDLVHSQLEYANILGPLAARLAGRPTVASLQNVAVHQDKAATLKRLLEGVVLRALAARVIVVASSAVEESSRNFHLPKHALVAIPNAIDLRRTRLPDGFDRAAKRQQLGLGARGPLICTVARLHPDKGHRFLFQAAERLTEQYPEAVFALVGRGDEEQELRAQASASAAAERIQFLGERSDVPEILASSDLFVLPSLNEGLSIAMLEAMAVGVPVVATDVGGASDILITGQTGWLVPSGDPTALADAIGDALSHPERARAYAERARAMVETDFSIETHARRLEALYRQVLAESSKRSGAC
jgi:glycosyltransferase involved in cell wall biosynthesis